MAPRAQRACGLAILGPKVLHSSSAAHAEQEGLPRTSHWRTYQEQKSVSGENGMTSHSVGDFSTVLSGESARTTRDTTERHLMTELVPHLSPSLGFLPSSHMALNSGPELGFV